MSSGLGESKTGYYDLSYYAYYNAFAGVATQPDQLTALASLPAPKNSTSGNPVTGSDEIVVASAEGRNLGFNTPASILVNGGAYDSEISPGTAMMLCLGLLALGVVADRRRRRSNRLSIVQ